MRLKKVLYHFRTRGVGAEAVHISGIANAFEELGFEVIFSNPMMIDPRKGVGAEPFGTGNDNAWVVAFRRFCPSAGFELLELFYNIVALWRNHRLLSRNDVAFVYERHAFFLFVTAWLARRCKVAYIVEVNELVGDDRVRKQPVLSALASWCDRFVFTSATLVVPVSSHLAEKIVALGVDSAKIMVLPNAVDRRECEIPVDGAAVRALYSITDRFVIGFVGWFVQWHRLELLVNAFAQLAHEYPQVHLLLVGSGPLGESLQDIASEASIPDRLTLTGAIPHERVASYIAALDVAVIAHSNVYRSPIKLFEYMAQGIAIVAPETEPIMSVITDNENGLSFAPGDGNRLFLRLRELVRNPDLCRRLGAKAKADVFKKHTWQANVEKILARVDAIGLDSRPL